MRAKKKEMLFCLLLVIAYVLAGKATLLLALPPGYASAIFPSAGIAVAAAFIAFRGALPSVFLGSFLLNVWAGYSSSHQLDGHGLLAAGLIAAASMLQAFVGGLLLRRVLGYPAPFDSSRELLRFMLLVPVICLTSATLSSAGLWKIGVFETDSLAINWFTWWVGDSLGVMIMLPIVMAFIGEPRALWQPRIVRLAVPMALIFVLLVSMFFKANQWEQDVVLAEFRRDAQQSQSQIQIRLEEMGAVLQGMHGLFVHDARGEITRQEFHRFSNGILENFPMVQALEWAPRIEASRRQQFEAAQRRDAPNFEIREPGADGGLQRAGKRALFYPVTYFEPLLDNEAVLGLDLASTSQRRKALDSAIRGHLPATTEPVTLVQSREKQRGILIMQAVEAGAESGVVLAVVKLHDLVEKSLPVTAGNLVIRLVDSGDQSVLYDNFTPGVSAPLFETEFDFGLHHYHFEAAPTEAYYKRHRGWQSWGVLALGAFGASLLGALLLLGTGYTARMEAQVAERTKALKESETRFVTMANSSPVFIWLSNRDNVATWFNQTLLDFIGEPLENALAGGWIARVHPDDGGCLEAFVHHARLHEPFEMEFRLKRRDGEYRWILDTALPHFDADGQFVGYIGSGIDITERKRATDLLQRMAHHDALTGLPNRMMFDDRLQHALAVAKRDMTGLALMFVDLDNFKPINDELGHEVGDMVLKEVARRMLGCVRESDTVARIGGDEFVVLMALPHDEQDALLVAEKMRQALCQPFKLAGHVLNISSSIGIAIFPEHGLDDRQLIRRADIAMYNAKKSGRNAVKMYCPSMQGEAEV